MAAVLVPLAFFVVCELAARLLPWSWTLAPVARRTPVFGELLVSEFYESDPELLWRLRPHPPTRLSAAPAGGISYTWEVSTKRTRSPALPYEKPPGTYRLLCIGDSVTFGICVQRDETYPARLGAALQSKLRRPVEVINAGVPGYSSVQGLRYLRRELLRYSPDLVVTYFGVNDSLPGTGSLELDPASSSGLAALLNESRFYRSLAAGVVYLRDVFSYAGAESRQQVRLRTSHEAFDAINALCAANGAGVLHVTPVWTSSHRAVVLSAYSYRHEPAVDPSPLLAQRPAGDVMADECHPTSLGHGLIAQAILARLEAETNAPRRGSDPPRDRGAR